METSGCQHLHFFSAIKRGSVTEVCNVNSFGNPALRFKSLKDVYESEDAKRVSSTSAVELNKVKTEALCLPEVDSTLWKEDVLSSEFVNHGNEDLSDYPSMTLRQLKGILRRKKQKISSGSHSNVDQVYDNLQFQEDEFDRELSTGSHSNVDQVYDNLQFQEDEFDLVEPLIHWKTKLSKKMPKRKRVCSSGRTVRPELAISVKLDPVLGSESFDFANRELMSLVCTKRDDPESESFEVPSQTAFADVLEPKFEGYPCEGLEGHENKNQRLVLYGDEYQEHFSDSSEGTEIDGCSSSQEVPCTEYFPDLSEDIVYGSDEIMSCRPCVVSSTPESELNSTSDNMFFTSTAEIVMPHKDHICHFSTSIDDSHLLNKTSRQSSSSPGVQALDGAVNTEIETRDPLPLVTRTESFSLQQSVSSLGSRACYNHEDEYVFTSDGMSERDQSRASSATDGTKDCWSPKNHFPSNLPTSEKQPPEPVILDPSSRIATFLDSDTLLAPVLQNPGRVTRKIIPPTSQERLCLSMDREELHDDTECKDEVFIEEKTKSNPSIARSNIENARRAEYPVQPGQLSQEKVSISPGRTFQKSRNEKRGSPPKGNLEQPLYSRSLPCISTACTSVKSCSKGAIAFSQRQMNDVDSLAVKLLNELKSMKDILEQKLLLNSCRRLSLRNNADEVVAAIKTATRVEENAKRWLSLMARDCDRFCKIMSLTQDGPSSHENEIPRESRKIVFADEAGERLCHVKFFENDLTSTGPHTSSCPNASSEAPPKEYTSSCHNASREAPSEEGYRGVGSTGRQNC